MSNDQEEWVVARIFGALPQAQMAAGLLESEGVECYVHGEQQSGMFRGLAVVSPQVMVRKVDATRAAEILADSDLSMSDPDAMHVLCDLDGERPELKDLENLQLDLIGLSLCSLGHGVPRATIEATIGDLAPGDDAGRVLCKLDLGATFYLDAADRLAGFHVQIAPDAAQPDLETFPGFWDPGGSLTPPDPEDLEAFFGEPAEDRPTAAGRELAWRLETATVRVAYNRQGEMQTFEVTFP